MVSKSKLERAHAHDGVVAVMAMNEQQRLGGVMSWVGEERWQTLVHEGAQLRILSGESQIRVLVGEHSILLMGDDHDVVGLVFVKGHPIVKSVVRMVRQLFRHAQNARKSTLATAPRLVPSAPANGSPSQHQSQHQSQNVAPPPSSRPTASRPPVF